MIHDGHSACTLGGAFARDRQKDVVNRHLSALPPERQDISCVERALLCQISTSLSLSLSRRLKTPPQAMIPTATREAVLSSFSNTVETPVAGCNFSNGVSSRLLMFVPYCPIELAPLALGLEKAVLSAHIPNSFDRVSSVSRESVAFGEWSICTPDHGNCVAFFASRDTIVYQSAEKTQKMSFRGWTFLRFTPFGVSLTRPTLHLSPVDFVQQPLCQRTTSTSPD